MHKLSIETKRRFPFFKLERSVDISFSDPPPLLELIRRASGFFPDEFGDWLDNTLCKITGVELINERGRPELAPGFSTTSEPLFILTGKIRDEEDGNEEHAIPFEIRITSKFKEFKGKDIIYLVQTTGSRELGLEEEKLLEVISAAEIKIERLEIGVDFFKPRAFSFYGVVLPDLSERILLSATEDRCKVTVESSNYSKNEGFSERVINKVRFISDGLRSPGLLAEMIEQ